jgi:hypothetical protein
VGAFERTENKTTLHLQHPIKSNKPYTYREGGMATCPAPHAETHDVRILLGQIWIETREKRDASQVADFYGESWSV